MPLPIKIERVARLYRDKYHPDGYMTIGELVSMADGSQWFHPYSGKTPIREIEANA
jgi:hypothetical protein